MIAIIGVLIALLLPAVQAACDEVWKGWQLSSYHPGGAEVVFCDGHVRFLPRTMDQETLERLNLGD